MAQLLNDRHSINVHLNITKRHIRLARHAKGAEELLLAIEPVLAELIDAKAIDEEAIEEIEYRRDLVAYEAIDLDDKVRDLSAACKKYDRDNPGLGITPLIFLNGTTPIIFSPNLEKPMLVEFLIKCIQNLGENHPLAAHIEPLQSAITKLQTTIDALQSSIDAKMMPTPFYPSQKRI